MEDIDSVLDDLFYLHAYGDLDEDRLDQLSIYYEIDCRELCKIYGITYNLNK